MCEIFSLKSERMSWLKKHMGVSGNLGGQIVIGNHVFRVVSMCMFI